jgi:hypothetical protein
LKTQIRAVPALVSQAPPEEEQKAFTHRRNKLGVFESVCPACFDVISTQVDEASLAPPELAHRCSEMILQENLDYFRSVPVPTRFGSKLKSKKHP